MLQLKIALGLLSVVTLWVAANAAEKCSNSTLKATYYTNKEGKRVTKYMEKCCRGYSRMRNRCQPVCMQSCENARCTAPNVCSCNKGYEKLSDFRCIPHCEDCDNGVCTKPNYCLCHHGYQPTANGSCTAECNNCDNGYCTIPNECECHEGYELVTYPGGNRSCEPICSQGCPNGRCTAPNQCTCIDGYIRNDAGDCVEPRRCPDGYLELFQEDHHVCEPICRETCLHGACIAPDVCECNPGYSNENSTEPFRCEPICANGCQNGNCVSPGECVCLPRYGKIADECIPLCEKCSLGHCIQPEVCICDRGYNLIDGDCVPYCEEECKNAICTGPNACTCLPGFNYTDINALFDCLPVCEDECVNGKCIAPDTCECNAGFVKYEDNYCIDPVELCRMECANGHCDGLKCICNTGYLRSAHGSCERTCPHGCLNGECHVGDCLCNENYRLSVDNSSVCEPICGEDVDYSSNGCLNGKCVEPNVCECDDGYDFIDDSRTVCEDVDAIRERKEAQQRAIRCQQECTNGKCRQGECYCDTGYGHPENDFYRCKPICQPTCRNATCVLPGRCDCNDGFIFINDSQTHCRLEEELKREKHERCLELCTNGECYGDKCMCMMGFVASAANRYNCQPHCDEPCRNGVCAGNNRCQCFDGYEASVGGGNCEPVCSPECGNGRCVNPNECSCNEGFYLSNSTRTCEKQLTLKEKFLLERQTECRASCKDGTCTAGVCQCNEGFHHKDGNTLTCEPFCETECEFGECLGNNICKCNDGYELTDNNVCSPICEEDCVNGFCDSPNTCKCHPGYMPTQSANACEPVCGTDGCTNGVCVSPNMCSCFEGYSQDHDDYLTCYLIPQVIFKTTAQSTSKDYYKLSYVPYFVPVIVAFLLAVTVLITWLVVRNRRKDYHVGKLGNVRKRQREARTTDYNDYNLVVLFPTETKENCVYFMPQVETKQCDELTKLNYVEAS